MTTALDTKLIPKVKTIVDRFGKQVTFIVPGVQSPNPKTDSVAVAGEKEHTVRVSPPSNTILKHFEETSIQVGDAGIGLPASELEFEPKKGMSVKIDDQTWVITNIRPVYSGDDIALYLLHLRL